MSLLWIGCTLEHYNTNLYGSPPSPPAPLPQDWAVAAPQAICGSHSRPAVAPVCLRPLAASLWAGPAQNSERERSPSLEK